MALLPRKYKFRKSQKGKNRGAATAGADITFGEFGLKALENGKLRSNHIEACRVTFVRRLRGAGKLWINVFPHKPVSKKPAEVRMGKGKGDLSHWEAVIKRGKVVFEISGVPEDFARNVCRLVAFKLPFKTKFVSKNKFQ